MSQRILTVPLTITAVAVLAAACTVSGGGGEAAGSCAITVTYGGRTYTDAAGADFTVGAALGTAVFPPCVDTPNGPDNTVPRGPATAYAVAGVDPRTAIAVRWGDGELMPLTVQPG
ncbi:DUF6281 family protein [Streptomyces sp. NPDC023723]|uniref:DUF6281 family protein n=1 Tax=Streptomyces sp. NPDC023723 TaxID=3154323 RepID=UPI0033FCA71A